MASAYQPVLTLTYFINMGVIQHSCFGIHYELGEDVLEFIKCLRVG
jgi:hypothetical protein